MYRYNRKKDRMQSMNERDMMSTQTTPLSAVTRAFEDLADIVSSKKRNEEDGEGLRLDAFCKACSLVSVLFGCLGIAFKFAELEYHTKVGNLERASKALDTLQDVLDVDVEKATVKSPGSNSRNLRRVRQGLDLIRALFGRFLTNNDQSLRNAASKAYAQVCAPYHSWSVRTAVYAGMYALPTRNELLLRLNETEKSAEKRMKRYIEVATPVIDYIDKLYLARNIPLNW